MRTKTPIAIVACAVLALTGCSKEADDVNKNLSRYRFVIRPEALIPNVSVSNP